MTSGCFFYGNSTSGVPLPSRQTLLFSTQAAVTGNTAIRKARHSDRKRKRLRQRSGATSFHISDNPARADYSSSSSAHRSKECPFDRASCCAPSSKMSILPVSPLKPGDAAQKLSASMFITVVSGLIYCFFIFLFFICYWLFIS